VPFSFENPHERTPSQENEGATAAPARSESTPCKHQARLQRSGPISGRGAAGIRVPAAMTAGFQKLKNNIILCTIVFSTY